MFRTLVTIAALAIAALFAAPALAAVDVNKATQAELEALPGVGPAISGRILAERQKSAFKDWPDLIERVRGVGAGSAAKLSRGGLTVGSASYAPVAAAADKPAKKASASRGDPAGKPATSPKAPTAPKTEKAAATPR